MTSPISQADISAVRGAASDHTISPQERANLGPILAKVDATNPRSQAVVSFLLNTCSLTNEMAAAIVGSEAFKEFQNHARAQQHDGGISDVRVWTDGQKIDEFKKALNWDVVRDSTGAITGVRCDFDFDPIGFRGGGALVDSYADNGTMERAMLQSLASQHGGELDELFANGGNIVLDGKTINSKAELVDHFREMHQQRLSNAIVDGGTDAFSRDEFYTRIFVPYAIGRTTTGQWESEPGNTLVELDLVTLYPGVPDDPTRNHPRPTEFFGEDMGEFPWNTVSRDPHKGDGFMQRDFFLNNNDKAHVQSVFLRVGGDGVPTVDITLDGSITQDMLFARGTELWAWLALNDTDGRNFSDPGVHHDESMLWTLLHRNAATDSGYATELITDYTVQTDGSVPSPRAPKFIGGRAMSTGQHSALAGMQAVIQMSQLFQQVYNLEEAGTLPKGTYEKLVQTHGPAMRDAVAHLNGPAGDSTMLDQIFAMNRTGSTNYNVKFTPEFRGQVSSALTRLTEYLGKGAPARGDD